MRESSLRSVLFPAPLRPISPTTSPCSTSNERSSSALMVVVWERARFFRVTILSSASRSMVS
jgi:hypothetical protein